MTRDELRTPEMIERVARAIEATMFAPHELPITGELHKRYLEAARAAIKAMREPTDEMVEASNREWDGRISHRSSGAWQAMIDAALGKTAE